MRRKKRGVCIYCRILFGGGQVRMPASVNTRLTEAAELSRPPRLMYLRRQTPASVNILFSEAVTLRRPPP